MDLGIFLPIANNGFIMSEAAPQYAPTFALNAEITTTAERIGFDFVLSQAKWRGFGGSTRFWDVTLESLTLTAALAAVTTRLGLIASVQPLLSPPAVVAKQMATIDDISGGRAALNVVAGSYLEEYGQMGLVPTGFAEERYDYAAEWVQLVSRLWRESTVDHRGRYFTFDDCRSDPKPRQRPQPPLVGAGSSESGMRFVAAHCTHAFVPTPDITTLRATAARYRAAAAERERTVKVYTVFQAVLASDDAAAAALVERWIAGADVEAIGNTAAAYAKPGAGESGRRFFTANPRSVFYGSAVPGGPATIAAHIERLMVEGTVDGVLLCFPNWLDDLARFADDVMPRLRQRGVVPPEPASEWAR